MSSSSFMPRLSRPNATGIPASRKSRSGAVPLPSNSNEPFYRSRIAIDRVALHDTPAGFRIMPGMPTTSDVKVGKRTVLSYLLGRILPVASEGMREP